MSVTNPTHELAAELQAIKLENAKLVKEVERLKYSEEHARGQVSPTLGFRHFHCAV